MASSPNCYGFFVSFFQSCLPAALHFVAQSCRKVPLDTSAAELRSHQEDLGNGAGEPVLSPSSLVALLSFITSCATDVYRAGVHDSLMALAPVGAGGARILALGSQPRGHNSLETE